MHASGRPYLQGRRLTLIDYSLDYHKGRILFLLLSPYVVRRRWGTLPLKQGRYGTYAASPISQEGNGFTQFCKSRIINSNRGGWRPWKVCLVMLMPVAVTEWRARLLTVREVSQSNPGNLPLLQTWHVGTVTGCYAVYTLIQCTPLLVEKAGVAPDMTFRITACKQERVQVRYPLWI